MREPTEYLENLGQRIRDKREAMRLSLEELSARLDMTKSGLWAIERGCSCPGADTLLRLCFTLGISPNKLLTGKETF
jgi:transcriptional regulator with XRE-family HTH domain